MFYRAMMAFWPFLKGKTSAHNAYAVTFSRLVDCKEFNMNDALSGRGNYTPVAGDVRTNLFRRLQQLYMLLVNALNEAIFKNTKSNDNGNSNITESDELLQL